MGTTITFSPTHSPKSRVVKKGNQKIKLLDPVPLTTVDVKGNDKLKKILELNSDDGDESNEQLEAPPSP